MGSIFVVVIPIALLWQIEGTGQVFVDSCAMAMVMDDRDVRDWRMA